MAREHPPVAELSRGPAKNAAPGSDLSALFDELHRPLYGYLLCAGLSGPDADDKVQETFLLLHQHLRKNGDRSNLRGWVFQVARNLTRNQFASAHQRLTRALEDHEWFRDPRATPEEEAIRLEKTRRLTLLLDKLPGDTRECLTLRAAGLKYREIAQILGIGISTVGDLIQRATTQLNEELL